MAELVLGAVALAGAVGAERVAGTAEATLVAEEARRTDALPRLPVAAARLCMEGMESRKDWLISFLWGQREASWEWGLGASGRERTLTAVALLGAAAAPAAERTAALAPAPRPARPATALHRRRRAHSVRSSLRPEPELWFWLISVVGSRRALSGLQLGSGVPSHAGTDGTPRSDPSLTPCARKDDSIRPTDQLRSQSQRCAQASPKEPSGQPTSQRMPAQPAEFRHCPSCESCLGSRLSPRNLYRRDKIETRLGH